MDRFKDLTIERDKITAALDDWARETGGSVAVDQKGSSEHVTITLVGQKPGLLIIHKKQNGKTTLQVAGKNLALSEIVADKIRKTCTFVPPPRSNLTVPSFSDSAMRDLLELLVPERAKVESEREIANGRQIKLKGIQGDLVSLDHYDTGTLVVQGSQLLLLQDILEFVLELVEDKRAIVEAQLRSLRIEVTADAALEVIKARLPRAHEFLGGTILAVMSPAVVLNELEIQLTDYSCFAFPALRGLEGYIKKLMLSKGVHVGKEGLGKYMDRDTLSVEVRAEIGCDATCTAVNRCYAYLKKQRHGLFHMDGNVEVTRALEDREEAAEIVDKVLALIDETYANILV